MSHVQSLTKVKPQQMAEAIIELKSENEEMYEGKNSIQMRSRSAYRFLVQSRVETKATQVFIAYASFRRSQYFEELLLRPIHL